MEIDKKLNLDWSEVEGALAEGSASGYKLAVLETDKIFREYLARFKYLNSDPDKKIKVLGRLLNKARELQLLKAVKEKLLEERKFDISRDDAKEIISEYWQIVKALDEFNRRTRRPEKFWLRLRNSSFLNFLRNFLVAFFALILIIKFFSAAKIGKEIIQKVVEISELLFWTVIIIAGIIGVSFIGWKIKKKVESRK